MKKLTETQFFKFFAAGLILTVNVLFYTLNYPWTGAVAAWEVHPLFWGMWQSLFLYASGSFIYFGIKKV